MPPLRWEDPWGDPLEFTDYPAIAKGYCEKVLSGKYPGCEYVRQACQRYLTMLDMAKTGRYGFTFSPAHAVDFLAFTEELPLYEDNFRHVTKTELEPWSIWVGCALYGFRDARGFRYTQECYLEIPRKSIKSVIATAIGLYDLRNPEATAPLVLIAASTLEQADRVFEPIHGLINHATDNELSEFYGLKATDEYASCSKNGGRIAKVASIGKRQDGWNPTTIILEELHAQNPDVYEVLKSALGSRGGQMLFQITTAGRDAFGLAWENRKAAIKLLKGEVENWRQFAVIYTVDEADITEKTEKGVKAGKRNLMLALHNEQIWIKACPNLGVSYDIDTFRNLALSAQQKAQEREEFFRTRLNIWTNSASKLFNMENFRRGARRGFKIEQFKGQMCWVAGDMSSKDDLTSIMAVFELPNDDLAIFGKHYAASDARIFSDPDYASMAREWERKGLLNVGRSGRVNHKQVEADIREWNEMFDVQVNGFDPAMAGILMDNLEEDRLPVVKYANKAHMMAAPVDDLMARSDAAGAVQMHYDEDDEVLEWAFGNVHGERRKDDTILMFKDTESSLNKIDPAVATAMANGLRMNPEFAAKVKKRPSVYEKRGLLGAAKPTPQNGNADGDSGKR